METLTFDPKGASESCYAPNGDLRLPKKGVKDTLSAGETRFVIRGIGERLLGGRCF